MRSAKTVIRCKHFASSHDFYAHVLRMRKISEWDEPGGKGCIFAVGAGGEGGYIEIFEMATSNPAYDASFSVPFVNQKIDLQLRTESVDSWVESLTGTWPFEGPEKLPWGQRWIRLRDPDDLVVAIYEGEV